MNLKDQQKQEQINLKFVKEINIRADINKIVTKTTTTKNLQEINETE
jgi:hypothetical protein